MSEKKSITDVTRTRLLQIYDLSDRLRMQLYAHKGLEPKMTIFKEDGTPALEVSSIDKDFNSRRITFFGKEDKWRLRITANDNGAEIGVYDNEGKCVKTWTLTESEGNGGQA